jgi:two-component system, OmpR family, KDP operon response regulator KdpE
MTDILLVEDEPPLRRALRTALRAHGFMVAEVATGEDALVVVAERPPDLVVLDLGLPGLDGVETLRRLRRFSTVPVIVLSVRDRQATKIQALDLGADDYVTKPFDPAELLARIRAVLRRRVQPRSTPAVLITGNLKIDLAARQVLKDGQLVHLTKTELALLEELVSNPGKLLTHDYLLRRVWGTGYSRQNHYLRVYIAQLRHKLGDDASNPCYIQTEPGLGYRWLDEPASP